MTQTIPFEDIVLQKIDNRGKTPPVFSAGYPLLEVNSLSRNRLYPDISKVSKWVNGETYASWFRQYLEKDDILFSTVGTIAESAIIPAEPIYAVAQNILGFRFKSEIIDPKYALYLMRSSWFINQITGRTIETVQKSIKWSDMRGIKINLPDLDTQEKIAAILWSLDEKIELNRKMNETLEQMGQALFRHYFIDNPEAEKWEKTPLGSLCDSIASGGTPSTRNESYYSGDVLWFSTKELQDSFLFGSEKTITEEGLAKSSAKLFPINTVTMAIYAAPTVGRLGILTKEASFNQATCGLVAKPEIGYEFIYLYLLLSRVKLNNMANGAAQQNISVGKVRDFKVMNPSASSLSGFKEKVEPIFVQIKNNTEQIQTLTALRETLLPRLISGKVKV